LATPAAEVTQPASVSRIAGNYTYQRGDLGQALIPGRDVLSLVRYSEIRINRTKFGANQG
jgi:hypothetical protein